MSASAVAVPGGTRTQRLRTARAGVAMAVATFAMAGASALEAVLYLSRFGTDVRTDGFFIAFALYTTFGVFAQSLRLTAVPLLVEPHARLGTGDFGRALLVVAIPVILLTTVLAGPLAAVLAPGLDATGRSVTAQALPPLGGAMVLQLWAAGGATVLAIRGRFEAVAAAYIAGAIAGLATFVVLLGPAGELTLAWAMLAMAVVTCGWMLVSVRRACPREDLRPRTPARRAGRDAAVLLARTSVYLAVNALFVITLAAASHAAAGDATVLSYAYLFASYLVAGTGTALGMSRIPDMTRAARAQQRELVVGTVPQGFRYAVLVVAPAMGLLIVAGAPLVHELLPASLDADGARALQEFALLLTPWTVAALLVSFLLPTLFAIGRARLVNGLALPLVAVHVLATLAGQAAGGARGTVAAFCVAPALFAVALLLAGAGRGWAPLARRVGGDVARFGGLAVVTSVAAALATYPLDGVAAAVAAGAVGATLYGAGALLLARDQLQTVAGVLRPRSG